MQTHTLNEIPHGSSVPAPWTAVEVPGLVTKKTVADAAAVSVRCIELWMQRKKIPFVRLSARCVRFHLPSVIGALRRFETKAVG